MQSTNTPVVLVDPVPHVSSAAPVPSAWIETALTIMFTATAVLFVSFLAVVTGLV
ncbi:MAG TPA: hypothetical protein VH206_13710 [Xanthobacteraceae bacterium]|jgi:hypothetical protein|nr:hypothetical protein [Xanthobacteraceae bacterium]